MQYIVYDNQIKIIPDDDEEQIVKLCFEGKTVYLHDTSCLEYTDCDCVSVFQPLDRERIELLIGKSELESELENATDYGYTWFDNIQYGDMLAINEIIRTVSSELDGNSSQFPIELSRERWLKCDPPMQVGFKNRVFHIQEAQIIFNGTSLHVTTAVDDNGSSLEWDIAVNSDPNSYSLERIEAIIETPNTADGFIDLSDCDD